jgi:hypothetical protein
MRAPETKMESTMRATLIAAIVASASLLAIQAPALAQGASAYPNTNPYISEPSPASAPEQAAPPHYGRSGVGLYNEVRPTRKEHRHAQ